MNHVRSAIGKQEAKTGSLLVAENMALIFKSFKLLNTVFDVSIKFLANTSDLFVFKGSTLYERVENGLLGKGFS